MPVTRLPSQRNSAWPAGIRSTKMANRSWSPSPQTITRQRMARRLCESKIPMARMSARPTSPDNRLARDTGPAGCAGAPGAWISAPGTVGAAWVAAESRAVVSAWTGRSIAASPRQARPGISQEPATAAAMTANPMSAPRRPPAPGSPRLNMPCSWGWVRDETVIPTPSASEGEGSCRRVPDTHGSRTCPEEIPPSLRSGRDDRVELLGPRELLAHLRHHHLPLRPREERVGEPVQNAAVDLGPAEAELGVRQPVLVAQRDPCHEPAIGAERQGQARVEIPAHRVVRRARNGAGLDVARDVGLDQDAPVADVVLEPRILVQPGAMADPVRVAAMHRLGDRPGSRGLTRVDGDAQAGIGRHVERGLVHTGRTAGLAAGQVERHHAAILVGYAEPGDRQRHVGRVVPERAVDHPGHDAEVALAPGQALQLGVERLLHGEPAAGAELGAVTHLEIAEPVARRVLHHLVSHPLDAVGRLQERDGVLEPREVILEAARVAHHHELPELAGIRGRERELGRAG